MVIIHRLHQSGLRCKRTHFKWIKSSSEIVNNFYEAAKAANPQHWSGATRNWQPVRVVHLNPDKTHDKKERHKEFNNAV